MNKIKVSYKVFNTSYSIYNLFNNLPNVVALDFETYSPYEKYDGLSHPSKVNISHLSIGISKDTAYVVVVDNIYIENLLCSLLVKNISKQIWHNSLYDLKLLHYKTNKFPTDYEDTMLLMKSKTNHVKPYKAKVDLKELMSVYYGGDWSLQKDNFKTIYENRYDPKILEYCAIDACATCFLWELQSK